MKHFARVVFAGGGHAHLYSLKHADRLVRQGAEITVIGPDRYHYYSGMGPGLLSGIYAPDDVRIDIQGLIEKKGGRFVKGYVTGIDPYKKRLFTEGGETFEYDIASFNLGSRVQVESIQGGERETFPVKPIGNLYALRQTILSMTATSVPRILVIGTGPAGVEVAGNIWRVVSQNRGRAEIILAGPDGSLLPRLPDKAGIHARDSLTGRGITILFNSLISSLDKGIAHTRNGSDISYDICVIATGARPNKIFYDSGIETAGNGSLVVNSCLRSTSQPNIFGGGDCITLDTKQLDMVGVYAVRQAPSILYNILASIRGETLKEFVPQKNYLQILNLGNDDGILIYKPLVLRGRWAFMLKNLVDKRFISRFRQ